MHFRPWQVTISDFRLPFPLVPRNQRSPCRIEHLSILRSDRDALRHRSHTLLRRHSHSRDQRLTLRRRLQPLLSIVRLLPRRIELEPFQEWLRFSNADRMAFVLRKVPCCVNLILQTIFVIGFARSLKSYSPRMKPIERPKHSHPPPILYSTSRESQHAPAGDFRPRSSRPPT
jgi:hypothetical protein